MLFSIFNMEKLNFSFEFNLYNSLGELDSIRKSLIKKAVETAHNAYAPYSKFRVGAAVLLENDEIICGNNQENASYPVGICAERTLLSFVHAQFPELKKIILAISVLDTNKDVSPCGLCRQTILEYETIQNQDIEILLHSNSGRVLQIPSGKMLLPLHFNSKSLN